MSAAGVGVGKVIVATTSDGGHSPEFFAEQIVRRLIHVGDKAPEPIRAQALMFQDSMRAIVLDGLRRAIESDRIYRK
jgi:hypothetical protein